METVLKQHNQIELPQEICRKVELMPGIRLNIELDSATGKIILIPITNKLTRIYKGRARTDLTTHYK